MKINPGIDRRDIAPSACAPDKKQSPDAPLIDIKNLVVCSGKKKILANFSLALFSGERVVVTGESGSGKSTLARCILGFVTPQSGSVFICGTRLSPDTVWQLRREIAYIPQDPEPGPGTLEQWLGLPFTYKANRGLRKNIEKIPEMAACLGLGPETLDTDASRLSGGEKQRAAIMAALLLDRRIILADEPTSALDRVSARRVMQYLHALPGITSLMISHDTEMTGMANRVIRLDKKTE